MTTVASTVLTLNLVIYSVNLSSRYLLKNILLTAVLDVGYTNKNSTYFNNSKINVIFHKLLEK